MCTCHINQRQRSSWADAKCQILMLSGRIDKICRILIDQIMNKYLLDLFLHLKNIFNGERCWNIIYRIFLFALHHRNFICLTWIAQRHTNHETVKLRLRQQLCTRRSCRVLCCNYHKWLRHFSFYCINCDSAFFHNLKQCRLCLW